MNLVIGILLFGLGIIALFAWLGELISFFKGILVLSLLFWGAIAVVVGLAQRKSKARLDKAKKDAPSPGEGGER